MCSDALAPTCDCYEPLEYPWMGYETVLMAAYKEPLIEIWSWYKSHPQWFYAPLYERDGDCQAHLFDGPMYVDGRQPVRRYELIGIDPTKIAVFSDLSAYLASNRLHSLVRPEHHSLLVLFKVK